MSAFLLRYGTSKPNSYSTNWNLTEDPLSEAGNWLGGATNGGNWSDLKTASGLCYAKSGSLVNYQDALGVLNPAKFNIPPDQEATVVISETSYTPPESHELEILLRWECANNYMPGIECLIPYAASEQCVLQLGAYSPSGNFTVLTTGGAGLGGHANGDSIRCKMVGTAISCYKNGSGTAFMTATDATRTSGTPGIGAWVTSGGTPQNFCSTSFSCQPSS